MRIVGVLLVATIAAGCADENPAGPSSIASQQPPSVSSISENAGSTAGGTPVTILGAGFANGADVTFGGLVATALRFPETSRSVPTPSDRSLSVAAPPHAPGVVDVVITNPDHQSVRLTSAFTYKSPGDFDFNGTWDVVFNSGIVLTFVISNNALVNAGCLIDDPILPLTFSPVPVIGGAVSVSTADGRGIQARIVSTTAAVGSSSIPLCDSLEWIAKKRVGTWDY